MNELRVWVALVPALWIWKNPKAVNLENLENLGIGKNPKPEILENLEHLEFLEIRKNPKAENLEKLEILEKLENLGNTEKP